MRVVFKMHKIQIVRNIAQLYKYVLYNEQSDLYHKLSKQEAFDGIKNTN